jgi:hypothetical protein
MNIMSTINRSILGYTKRSEMTEFDFLVHGNKAT